MEYSFATLLEGFFLGLSLIIPIGTQNMYVLRQGVLGRHYLAASLVCSLCDTLLIVVGAMGVGTIIASSVLLRQIAVVGGALFLGYYGTKSFRRAFTNEEGQSANEPSADAAGLKMVIFSSLAFSLLNPHAILDTTVLIGSIAAQKVTFDDRLSFTIGACIASWV